MLSFWSSLSFWEKLDVIGLSMVTIGVLGELFVGFVSIWLPFNPILISKWMWLSQWLEKSHPNFDLSDWIQLKIPIILLLAFFAYHIVLAPYEIYKEMYENNAKLELKLDKLLNQSAPLLVGFEIAQHPNSLQTNCTIILQNPNLTQGVDDVELSIVAISPPIPHGRDHQISTDIIRLLAIEFSPYGMNNKKLTGMQKAFFPVFVVFETNPPSATYFQFTGAMAGLNELTWKGYNHFSPEPGREYTFTFQARAHGLRQVERQFKLAVAPKGHKPQMTFSPV